MDLKTLRYDVDDRVAVITLNRPDRLNAWTARMEREYAAVLDRAEADPDVRVVVVTGAGRGFCAGADFKALDRIVDAGSYEGALGESGEAELPEPTVLRTALADVGSVVALPTAMSKPVIAAVNGPAAGVGFCLMCFADIRFAASDAKITTSFARLGLPAEHGVSWLLVRLVGPGVAADLLLSSRVVLGDEAARIGLVNAAVPKDEVLGHAVDYARRVASECSSASMAFMKTQLRDDMDRDLPSAVRVAVDATERMVTEADFTEAVAAQRERRPPRF